MNIVERELARRTAVKSLRKQQDGSYVLLNMWVKPIGFGCFDAVDEKTDARCIVIPQLSEVDCKRLTCMESGPSNMERIRLYAKDLPDSDLEVRHYLRRLKYLSQLGPIERGAGKIIDLFDFKFERREVVIFNPNSMLK